jgi:hypothetical protein
VTWGIKKLKIKNERPKIKEGLLEKAPLFY